MLTVGRFDEHDTPRPPLTPPAMRPLLALFALLTLAGCDSEAEPGVADDILIVSLGEAPTDGPAVRLQTEGDYRCGAVLTVAVEQSVGLVRVGVEGVDLSGPTCSGPNAPAQGFAELPVPNPTVDVEVRYRGATDLYRYACGFAGCDFTAVRTSTTRLGPR